MKKQLTGNHRPKYTHYVSFGFERDDGDIVGFKSFDYRGPNGSKLTKTLVNWYNKHLSGLVSKPPFKKGVAITNVIIVKKGL